MSVCPHTRWALVVPVLLACQTSQPVQEPVFAAIAKNLCLRDGRTYHCFRYSEQLLLAVEEVVARADAMGLSCAAQRCEASIPGEREVRVVISPDWKGVRLDLEVAAREGETPEHVTPLLARVATEIRNKLSGDAGPPGENG